MHYIGRLSETCHALPLESLWIRNIYASGHLESRNTRHHTNFDRRPLLYSTVLSSQ